MNDKKFRAWDGILKEYGPDGFFTGFGFFGEVLTFDMIGMRIAETMDKRPHLNGVNLLGTNDFTIEQFTGLKDKNGKDIYEGDVLKFGRFALNDIDKFGDRPWEHLPEGVKETDITTQIGPFIVVVWDIMKLELLRHAITDNPDVDGAEIVGNVHENPELIRE